MSSDGPGTAGSDSEDDDDLDRIALKLNKETAALEAKNRKALRDRLKLEKDNDELTRQIALLSLVQSAVVAQIPPVDQVAESQQPQHSLRYLQMRRRKDAKEAKKGNASTLPGKQSSTEHLPYVKR
jgi:hypothetical protein